MKSRRINILHELLYVSVETCPLTKQDVTTLLAQSREKNAKLGVTGILVAYKKHFLQVLEGERDTIFDLFHTIRKDERHMSVISFWDGPIEKRGFQDWRMAFLDFNEMENLELQGFYDSLQKGLSSDITEDHLSVIKKLLVECVNLL
jgi:hypothetical protein